VISATAAALSARAMMLLECRGTTIKKPRASKAGQHA